MSVGLRIGSPPEFGPGGTRPALYSEPLVISESMFTVKVAGSDVELVGVQRAAVKALPPVIAGLTVSGAVVAAPVLLAVVPVVAGVALWKRKALEERQLVHSQMWRRDDPVVQLPPGASEERTVSLTVGIERSRTRELGAALGVKPSSPAALSGTLGAKFGASVTLRSSE